MDLEVRVQDRVIVCKLFREVEGLLLEALRQWNNFDESDKPFQFSIRRIPNNDPPTLGVKVSDDADSADIFGRG